MKTFKNILAKNLFSMNATNMYDVKSFNLLHFMYATVQLSFSRNDNLTKSRIQNKNINIKRLTF